LYRMLMVALCCVLLSLSRFKTVSDAVMKKLDEQHDAITGVKRALEAQQQIPSFSMSSAGSDKNWSVITRAGFQLDVTAWTDELSTGLRGDISASDFNAIQPAPFAWDPDRTESAQKAEYLQHLRQFVVMPRDLSARVGETPNQLLDTLEDGRLPFKLTGTGDGAVFDTEIENAISNIEHATAKALLVVFELKKKITEPDLKQAAAELIAADLHSLRRPFAVLTDLMDDWRFLWLEAGKKIKIMRVPKPTHVDPFLSRRCASLFMRRLLAEGVPSDAERQQAIALLDALPIPVGKRQKLSPVKERRPSRDEEPDEHQYRASEVDEDGEDDDVDGPGWGAEDRKMVLFRQVRQMIRHTPWLQEVCRPSIFAPMSADACAMFS
jgi:hypothetical protein